MQNFQRYVPEKKQASGFLHVLGGIGVFVFTATCTIDLFKKITPVETPWLPWLAVAILEYGLFNWGNAYLHKYDKANHLKKNLISLFMACFSGLCIAVVTTVELAHVIQVKGMAEVPTELLGYAVWVPVSAVGLNVLAYLGCLVWSNETPTPVQSMPHAMIQPSMPGYYMIQSEHQQGGYIQPPFTMLPLPQTQQYQNQQMNASIQQSQTLHQQGEQASGVQQSQGTQKQEK